ncbi:aminoglycoside phosphotransferase family protein [Paenibacillus sp. HJGM_3]|uniref:aminoglycoside phosphotransferase family protein n=1 Tax=Paenibacillus sp. HJGM_3 TaxID=3379816 RepID=UPI00385E0B0D
MNETNEWAIDISLVKRLIASQFPQWAHHPLRPLASSGTDNAIYRLGADMAVRLPRVEWATGQVEKEHVWLPKLAPLLPLAIPTPLAMGYPAEGYPWHWSVYRWLEGENAIVGRIDNPRQAATALAQFVAALQRIDAAGGPPPGTHNSGRGVPLAMRDAPARNAIATLSDWVDPDKATAVWEEALQAPVWHDAPVWLHGDLHPGNLLVVQGRVNAVIDFGTLGIGDPACDLMVAWTMLSADSRDLFRASLSVDDATWTRGRGWALSFGLIALAYYMDTNPVLASIARRTLEEVLADGQETGQDPN